jgi:hypothetical protein
MKRKIVALGLAAVLCLSLPLTAFAAEKSPSPTKGPSPTKESAPVEEDSGSSDDSDSGSSTSSSSSSKTESTSSVATSVEAAKPGQAVAPKAVTVAIVSADGKVSAVSLDTVITDATTTIIASAASPANAVATIQSLLTSEVTPQFLATIEALAEMKGSNMVVNNMGTIKTAAVAKDAFGNTIASAGVVKNVTSGALILLMSVNADGTVEYVEGLVDPVTGAVLGAFQGTPSVITVLVLA